MRFKPFALLAVLALAAFAVAQEVAISTYYPAPAGYYSTIPGYGRVSHEYNTAIVPLPGFTRDVVGNERIIFDTTYVEGGTAEFGAISKDGYITTARPDPYSDSTVRITASEVTIQRILNAPDPYAEFKIRWGHPGPDGIQIEGLNFLTSFRLFFSNIVLQIFFLITPSYAAPTRTVSATPTPTPIPTEIVPLELTSIEPINCMGGSNTTPQNRPPVISQDDRARFTNVTDNITVLRQPSGNTCSPTGGAIDLTHWNDTIAPGIVNMSTEELIRDLAKRMNTTTTGTTGANIAKGLASYFRDHGWSNFTIKYYYKPAGGSLSSFTKSGVIFIPDYAVAYSDLASEYFQGENIIMNVQTARGNLHTTKVIALKKEKDASGKHLMAIVNPETGVEFVGIDDDGNIDNGGSNWKLFSFIAVSQPKKQS